MKSKFTILFVVIVLLLSATIITSRLDYSRIIDGKKPILSFSIASLKDGGTEVFLGFEYQVISWHQLTTDDKNQNGYLVGEELFYFQLFKYCLFIPNNIVPYIKLNFNKVD